MNVPTRSGLADILNMLTSSILTLALILSTLPFQAFAQEGGNEVPVSECAQGEVYSAELEACVSSEPPVEEEQAHGGFCVIVSDPMTKEGEDPAVVLSEISSYWTAMISEAFWIWGEDPAAHQDVTTTETFVRVFTLDAIPTSAEFNIAADDGYKFTMNGQEIGEDDGYSSVNFTLEGQDTYGIGNDPSPFVVGVNTLVVEATNIAWIEGAENPGGLLFRLEIDGANCVTGGDEEESGSIIIEKEVTGTDEEQVNFTFSVVSEEGDSTPVVVETNGRFGSEKKEFPVGRYAISEVVPEGWDLTTMYCTDEDSYEVAALIEDEEVPPGETVFLDEGETITCRFFNEKIVTSAPEPEKEKRGSSTKGRVRSSSGGQVLGASTECSPLITEFLGAKYPNSREEVVKLQNFLNGELGMELPISGAFDSQTEAAVRVFQAKYWEEVLQPWFAFPQYGVHDSDDTTGIVYKTTKWKINNLYCPGSEALSTLP